MRQVQVLMHHLFVLNWDEGRVKCRINIFVQGWRGMAQLAQDCLSINVVQHVIIVVGLVWESAVIEEDIIRTLLVFRLWCNMNWRMCGVNRRECYTIATISRCFLAR